VCATIPIVIALPGALEADRANKRFGGWHGAGDTAAASGITVRRTLAD